MQILPYCGRHIASTIVIPVTSKILPTRFTMSNLLKYRNLLKNKDDTNTKVVIKSIHLGRLLIDMKSRSEMPIEKTRGNKLPVEWLIILIVLQRP